MGVYVDDIVATQIDNTLAKDFIISAYTESVLKKFATEANDPFDQHSYQSGIGSLLYLSVATRPDILYAVSKVAIYSTNPITHHWIAVKRIMRYLKGTTNLGLVFKSQENCNCTCVGFSDADWGGDFDDRMSTSGYLVQIGGGARSKRVSLCQQLKLNRLPSPLQLKTHCG